MKTPREALELAKTFSTLDTAALILVTDRVAVELRRMVEWLRITPQPNGSGADRLTAASRTEVLAAQLFTAQVHRPAEVVLTRYAELLLDGHPIEEGGGS